MSPNLSGQPPAGGQWGVPGGYPAPPAPPKRRGGQVALIIGLVVLLLVCPCLGLAGWTAWQVSAQEDGPSPLASATPSPSSAGQGQEHDFARGDCVVNDGTDDNAELRKVPCGPNTWEVLRLIPATADGDQCEILAPQATANYVHDNPVDRLDYVLCLQER